MGMMTVATQGQGQGSGTQQRAQAPVPRCVHTRPTLCRALPPDRVHGPAISVETDHPLALLLLLLLSLSSLMLDMMRHPR